MLCCLPKKDPADLTWGIRGHGDGPGVTVFLATLLLLSGCMLLEGVLMTDQQHVSLSGQAGREESTVI